MSDLHKDFTELSSEDFKKYMDALHDPFLSRQCANFITSMSLLGVDEKKVLRTVKRYQKMYLEVKTIDQELASRFTMDLCLEIVLNKKKKQSPVG